MGGDGLAVSARRRRASIFVQSSVLPFVMQILWVMWARLARINIARCALRGIGGALPLAVLTACDPCAGTIDCSSTPHVTLTGTIVDHTTGAGISGARIDLRVTDAGGFVADASSATNAQGLWQVTTNVRTAGAATAQITVASPNSLPYAVPNLPVRASTGSGDATVVGLWADIPFVRHLATVLHSSVPLVDAQVHFAPTSGPGLLTSQTNGTTNSAGIFELDFVGKDVGQLVGVLTITHPSLSRPFVIAQYTIPVDYRFVIPGPSVTIRTNKLLAYGGELIFRGTGARAPGVGVDFQRTSGIATTADHVSTVTNNVGFFVVDLTPVDNADGEVVGDLTFTPPASAPTVYKNIHLATYDSTFLRSIGLWAYGERWLWTLEVWRNDSLKRAPGVRAQFTRTGGLAISPNPITGLTTGSDGRVQLSASVQDTGIVDGQLTVFPQSGPPRVITGIHLRTNADDQLHFAGIVSFGPSLRYVGEVLTTSGTPVVGAHVEWTQTSGIAATPAVLDTVTDSNGRFPLTLFPSTDGGAIGRVRVRPPPPWSAGTEFVFDNLRLDTFESSELKLAVTYRIPPP
jgi:hypothetical protein